MRLSQETKTETGLFDSHSVHFCTFVYTQVVSLSCAQHPFDGERLVLKILHNLKGKSERTAMMRFVMVMVGMRDLFDEQ